MEGAREAEAMTSMVTRIVLDGTMYTLRVGGKAALFALGLIDSAIKNSKDSPGRKNLKEMLKSGKETKVFTFDVNKVTVKQFEDEAARYGLKYVLIKQTKDDKEDGVFDIMCYAEDASRITRILERLNVISVELTAEAAVEGEASADGLDDGIVPQDMSWVRDLIGQMLKQDPKRAAEQEENLSAASSVNFKESDLDSSQRSSVQEDIDRINENLANQPEERNIAKELLSAMFTAVSMKEKEVEQDKENDSVNLPDALFKEVPKAPNLSPSEKKGLTDNDLAILDSMGIQRRYFTNTEQKYVNTWRNEYGFGDEMILHACDKAQTAKPDNTSLNYVNGVLKNWHDNNLHTIDEVENFGARKSSGRQSQFNNFTQTNLSSQLEEMEEYFLREVNGFYNAGTEKS